MPRVLVHATHYPHPEHLNDLLTAMSRISAAAPDVPGLEAIGAFWDADHERVLAVTIWSSPDAMQAGMGQLAVAMGEVPFDEWERQPRQLLMLPEVHPTSRDG